MGASVWTLVMQLNFMNRREFEMFLTRKLLDHFKGNGTDWQSEALGGVVVAMVAFLCASMLITIAVVPVILYAANFCLVTGAASTVYGVYAAWRIL